MVSQMLMSPKLNINAKNFEKINDFLIATQQGFVSNKNYPDIEKILLA